MWTICCKAYCVSQKNYKSCKSYGLLKLLGTYHCLSGIFTEITQVVETLETNVRTYILYVMKHECQLCYVSADILRYQKTAPQISTVILLKKFGNLYGCLSHEVD
jgi:hypothetical protein